MTALAASVPTSRTSRSSCTSLGAMILVGGLLTGASRLAFARGERELLRLGYWSLLAVALPGSS